MDDSSSHEHAMDVLGSRNLELRMALENSRKALQYAVDIFTPGRVDGPTQHHIDMFLQQANTVLAVSTAPPPPDIMDQPVTEAERASMIEGHAQDAWEDELDNDGVTESFQLRVQPWMLDCFGAMIASDKVERNHRFLEEALELVQALGCTQGEAHTLVGYVYGRPSGDPIQEVGGVMVTLAALCLAQEIDMHEAGEIELARVWTMVEKIRAKQASKPKFGPTPIPHTQSVVLRGKLVSLPANAQAIAVYDADGELILDTTDEL